jgi:capsular polysaccharide biosynthesis protein/Mrp family chromosome partitioning ATPase
MSEPSPSLHSILRFAVRQGWLIVLVPVVAIAIAAFVVSREDNVYRASMGIVVAQSGGPDVVPLTSQTLNQTMTSILESDVVARAVVRDLGLKISPSDLQKRLLVQQKPNSSVLEVSYDSSRRRTALRILSEFARAFQQVARSNLGVAANFRNKAGKLNIVANVFDPPHLQSQPVSPRPARVLGFAAGLGLALGLILAFARESLDDRVRGPDDAEEWFEAPLLGTVPRGFRARGVEGGGQRRRDADRAVELLTANLHLRSRRLGPALLVASAVDDKASAAMVAGLGIALARAGQEVVCVETDLRRPNLGLLLDEETNGPMDLGLVPLLEGTADVDNALREVDLMRLSSNGDGTPRPDGRLLLLPLGGPVSESTPFTPARMSELVAALSARANYVLFESPPLLSSPQALALASAVNGVLLVARQGRTRRRDAQAVRTELDELGARNVAVVLVDA